MAVTSGTQALEQAGPGFERMSLGIMSSTLAVNIWESINGRLSALKLRFGATGMVKVAQVQRLQLQRKVLQVGSAQEFSKF